MSLVALSCAALLFLGCSDAGNDEPETADPDRTPVTTATAAPGVGTTDTPQDPTTAPDADTPATTRYVGNTGGSGVAMRDACAQDARTGSAWPDATTVLVLEVGAGSCEGWSYVASDGSLAESWVRNIYLVSQQPVVVVSRPPTGTPASNPTPTVTQPTPAPTQPPGPVVTLPQLSVSPNPLYFGEIPPGQVSIRPMLLANTSQDPVTITSVRFENGSIVSGAFELSPNCEGQTVAPGVACRLVLRFTATSPGQHTATMLVSSSSATAPLSVLVVGIGYVPE
jgi:hypothetical protein